MRKILVALCCFLFLFQSCIKDKLTYTYAIYKPIYKEKSEVYVTVKSAAPQPIVSPGKIFISGNYILLNDVDKGVHIIDNSDPAHPAQKAFINIPGNKDITLSGNTLYADLYSDLVVIDISDPAHSKLVKIIPNVFPDQGFANGVLADSSHYIVGWTKKDTTVSSVYQRGVYTALSFSSYAATPAAPGIAGSMARFALVNHFLYTVDNHLLKSFSLTDPFQPQLASSINAGWDIETIFPFKEKLFLGSKEGMFVFDLSDPSRPVNQTIFRHGTACDPVIADNNYAYITLRKGTTCGSATNELDVVDISNLSATKLVKTYNMTNPFGLAKDNDLLFICDGTDGIKMFNVSNPLNMILEKHISGLESYDVIAWNKNLIVVAKDGLYQYDYSNPNDLLLRSKMAINR